MKYNMGRQNSADKKVSKTAKKKTHLLQSKESAITSKKMSSNKKNVNGESGDVDSLIFLKDAGESKKLKGLDERIKLLKTELKSLIGDTKVDKDPDSTLGYNLVSSNSSNFDVKKLETTAEHEGNQGVEELDLYEAIHFSPNYNSTPAKFSECLDQTIDEMGSKIHDKIVLGNESQLNSKLDSTVKTSPLKSFPACSKNSSSNASLLPTERVEELLYRAFVLQNSVNFSHSEVGGSKENVSLVVENQKKSKAFKTPKRKPVRGKPKGGSSGFKACHRYPQRKRRRLISTTESDIEIVDLESSSGSNNLSKKNIVCVDLDVSNYDWSEPFEVNEDTEFHSDIQIIQDRENNENIQAKHTTQQELEKSISLSDTGNLTKKKIWECPVCFEQSKGQEIVATQCGHIFCRKCLENHISKLTNNCPSCRCNLKNKPFITLFNF